ncbi:hypothetical protein ACFE04_016365 [Oxalis oulophora]
MGRGKNKKTATMQEARNSFPENFSITSARNMRKGDLAAVIFGCKHSTIKECYEKKLFGLPAPHYCYIRNVYPGLPLFLFNYTDRQLHGVFEAAGSGQMNIDPYAWTGDDTQYTTSYPAQVKIKFRTLHEPVKEEQFAHLIADNYYEKRYFWFELDVVQTQKLMALFKSSPVRTTINTAPRPKWTTIFKDTKKQVNGLSISANSSGRTSNAWGDEVGTEDNVGAKMVTTYPGRSYSSVVKNTGDSTDQINEVHETSNLANDFGQTAKAWDEESETEENESANNETSQSDEEWNASDGPGSGEESWISENGVTENRSHEVQVNVQHSTQNGGDTEDVLSKLLREVQDLRCTQVKQFMRITSLEQELGESKIKIQKLNEFCKTIETVSCSPVDDAGKLGYEAQVLDESILIVGGYDGTSWLSSVDLYNPAQDLTRLLTSMTIGRCYSSVAKLNDELYILGGADGELWHGIVESYNVETNEWAQRPSLNRRKGNLASICLGEKIFSIGGGNGVECFSEVEMLDPDIGRWIPIRSMLQKRVGLTMDLMFLLLNQRFSPGVAEINGSLYAVGGYNGKDYLKSVERLDPREHSWARIQDMNSRRGCHALVSHNEKLYAMGGFDGTEMVTNVEVFDARFGSWNMSDSLNDPRGYAAAVVVRDAIYVIGGLSDENEVLDTVEHYKEGYGWQRTNLRAVGKRCMFSAIAY